MHIQKLVPALFALVMGLSFSASAGTPKGEARELKAEVTRNEKSTNSPLLWYIVSYDNPSAYPNGYVKAGTPVAYNGERSGAEAMEICPDGNTLDCLRGFPTAPTLPTEDAGEDQIQKD